jgi:hypothetical protein
VNQLSDDSDAQLIAEHTLTLVFMALGDALLGKSIADALGLPATAARDIALRQIIESPGLKFGAVQRKETKPA